MIVYVLLTKTLLGITKIDSTFSDLELAERRLAYLIVKCGDRHAYLYETRLATAADIYVPAVKQMPDVVQIP